jgi:hypothetical protein
VAAELPPQLYLVMDRGDRLVDVPLPGEGHQAVRRVEGEGITELIEVVREGELCRGARRQIEAGDVIGRRHHVVGQERVPLLVVLHDLGGVLDPPVIRQIERRVYREPGRVGMEPVVER